jgi:hypothetical protein
MSSARMRQSTPSAYYESGDGANGFESLVRPLNESFDNIRFDHVTAQHSQERRSYQANNRVIVYKQDCLRSHFLHF